MTGTDGPSPIQKEGPGALPHSVPSALWEGNQKPDRPLRPEAKLTQEIRHKLVWLDSIRAAKRDRKELEVVPGLPYYPLVALTQTLSLWAELLSRWTALQRASIPTSLVPWLELQECGPASAGRLFPGAAALLFVVQEWGVPGASAWGREIDQEGLNLKMLTWVLSQDLGRKFSWEWKLFLFILKLPLWHLLCWGQSS